MNQVTPKEAADIHEMVTAPQYRHIPTTQLAILAMRLGRVFVSPSTWRGLVRRNGWRLSPSVLIDGK